MSYDGPDDFGWTRRAAEELNKQLADPPGSMLDFLAQNPKKKFSAEDLCDRFGFKNTRSMGTHLKKTTMIAKELGIDQKPAHSWFVSWEGSTKKGWLYWLDADRAAWWRRER